ncbi:multicopper oxidase family protein [Ramlibacter sp.]|uniref:multicopper oxidase family protein n=1 Tax=Ramlibacter sp. TaxID=1917967 RepID=UPI002C2B1FAA|nr:multicopper oxidase domain-containing protein [Ramlibacter sp.]HWI81961.1 multicopper oxidase domain-containing protein [Ramlibacter sp.]
MANRRIFLQSAAAVGAAFLAGVPRRVRASEGVRLAKFVQALREFGAAGGIPLAASDGLRRWGGAPVQHYAIALEQFEDQLHPQLPAATRLWGYRPANVAAGGNLHLAGAIVAERGTAVQITVTNNLPARHILPVDASVLGAERGQGANHASLHLHGGLTPWISDGGPHAWFDPAGRYGDSATDPATGAAIFRVLNPALRPGQAEYFYPNQQGARMLWYHDHALGITRLNAYAGLASAYVITDDYERDTMGVGYRLPGPLDPRTKYLVFQDKSFVSTRTGSDDPAWSALLPASRPGDLWYAHEAEVEPVRGLAWPAPPQPSCVPEFFGGTILVNGTVAPFLAVEQRQYRLRMLNACNARFLNPRLVYAMGTSGIEATEPRAGRDGPAFVQIGTEGGFLPAPVMLGGPRQPRLLLAPAERADLIVDFRDVPAGSVLILYNDAPAPFPHGSAEEDYHPGNPRTPDSVPGAAPNTRTLLQIRVAARRGSADAPIALPPGGMHNPLDGPFLVVQQPGVPTSVPPGVPVRRLTLNEGIDGFGRLVQTIGTADPASLAGKHQAMFGRAYADAPTEVVDNGMVEVWEILNLTADTHPVHFHLANVQLLSRQAFNVNGYAGGAPRWEGLPTAPDANELGWKDTVRMNPGEATRVIMRLELPQAPFVVPPSPRTGGNEYVWHCHILEHEEHDMMRPLVVR